MKRILDNPTAPPDVRIRKISEITDSMVNTGFQGRKMGEGIKIWEQMLKEEELTIFMGLSGAMVPAGMRKILSYLIRERKIDCLVSTGANIFHDIHESLGGFHYKGTHTADDCELYKHGIDRIYDVFAVEDEFRKADHFISDFSKTLDTAREYSSRELVYLLGEKIAGMGGEKDSIIVSAYENNLPIFIPALADSSIGIGLMIARRKGININVNQMKDVDEITQIVEKSKRSGVIYIGGGVPKNFIQQTEVISSILGLELGGHDYAVQFTTDAPHWGGLSGCTFDEAISWGKISTDARQVQVFVDSTIALPIAAHSLEEKTGDIERKYPIFDWSGEKLEIKR